MKAFSFKRVDSSSIWESLAHKKADYKPQIKGRYKRHSSFFFKKYVVVLPKKPNDIFGI